MRAATIRRFGEQDVLQVLIESGGSTGKVVLAV